RSSSSSFASPASTSAPALPHPLAEPPAGPPPPQTQSHAHSQHYRLLKSESMPVHLGKDAVSGGDSRVPPQADAQGQSSKRLSSSPSIENLSGRPRQSSSSPPLPFSRGESDLSASSPPLSSAKKESFFHITRSRSHSKTMSRKETEEDLEAQVSFLQGQINDLEAMSKYCAKMMNSHICKIQEVILQEHLEKEDEVLVSLAGLKQIKDILKGALRFNQSQLEAEENEEINIADNHYTSAAEPDFGAPGGRRGNQRPQVGRPRRGPGGDGGKMVDDDEQQQQQEEEEQTMTPHEVESMGSEARNWEDYILVSQNGDLQGADGGRAASERSPPIRRGRGLVRMEPEGAAGTFNDPLSGPAASGSSSPDEGSTTSKDSDFTIVNPSDF
ncbi:TBC1 domain family member 5-like, partial [Hippocampus comes]|uniref:TBC1 domain family member 5-like n=1 Tax=Hippocampus comes TaxID=109280 RepID=UPI00094EF172